MIINIELSTNQPQPLRIEDFQCVNLDAVLRAFGATELGVGVTPRSECDCSDDRYERYAEQARKNTRAANAIAYVAQKALDARHNAFRGTFSYPYNAGNR